MFPLVILALSAPVVAQEKPIDEMFKVMSMDKQMAGGFEAMLPIVDQMSANFQLDQKGKEELKEVFRVWFNEDVDREKIISEIKMQYAQAFTDDEIKKITEFYKTTVGQKFLAKSPQLMQSGAQVGMREAQLKQAKLMERVKSFLDKRGIKQ